jgi:aminomethyltransferase
MVSADSAFVGAEVEVVTGCGPARAMIVDRPFYDPHKKLAAA